MRGRFKLKWLYQNKKWFHLFLIVIIGMSVIPNLSYFSFENLIHFSPDSLLLAAIVFFFIYVIKAIVLLIPISLLYIAAGVIFPKFWAIIITYIGLIAALSIGYFNGKSLGEVGLSKLLTRQKKIAHFLEARKENLPAFCFTARIFRLQFDLTNMICGAMDMPFIKFLIASLVGLSPTIIPYIFVGSYLTNPLSIEFWLPFSISILISLIAIMVHRFHKKYVEKQ